MKNMGLRAMMVAAMAMLTVFSLSSVSLVQAEDLRLTVSANMLQRFFQAAAPYNFDYELIKGQTAARITLNNPKVILEAGQPGRVLVSLDYQGQSQLLGLAPFSGQTRPEAVFSYDAKSSALLVYLKDLNIEVGSSLKIPLAGLIEPLKLPLTSKEPVQMGEKKLKIGVKKVQTRVTDKTVLLMVDYDLTPVPEKP